MTKKNTKKTNKKLQKFDLLINCTACETSTDVYNAYIDAKIAAGKAITKDEAEMIENRNPQFVCYCSPVVFTVKTPWYKRFWNWVTKPFKKNK